jgi:phosphoribosylanthranilate isomerase
MLDVNMIQIAGVIDQDEADMLQQCGVRWLGFPLWLPVHREDLTEAAAARIIGNLAPPAVGVLITYLDRADEIAALCRRIGTRIVQLHAEVRPEELARLRAIAPGLTVIKSLVVGLHDPESMARTLSQLTSLVDAFITDTYDPATGACGATGKTHDWAVSRFLVELSERPVILAGGLTPDNVKQAIQQVGPAGVDAHTGVENADGRKSQDKVRQFLEAAQEGFAMIHGV